MLIDRGYKNPVIDHKSVICGPFSKSEEINKESIYVYLFVNEVISRGISIEDDIHKDQTIGILQDVIEMITNPDHDVDKLIFVIPRNLEAFIKPRLNEYAEVYPEHLLMYNPVTNINVSKHLKVTRDSISSFIDDDNKELDNKEFPVMKLDDPIRRWYGFNSGDIIKIERTYCNEIYYRIVE
jgi:DNA-directed RNA polymerase subunit H (RpoH/RPB5)